MIMVMWCVLANLAPGSAFESEQRVHLRSRNLMQERALTMLRSVPPICQTL